MADFPSTARVVIIGGGCVGASCLYHLALAGWTFVKALLGWSRVGNGVTRTMAINLALLLAQRPPTCDYEIDDMWMLYSTARGEYITNLGSNEQLRRLTVKQRADRVRRYLDKTQRECSMIVHRKTLTRNWLCDREHWPRLQRLMLFPEELVGEGTPLKL